MPKIILRKMKVLELQEKISKLLNYEVKEKWNSLPIFISLARLPLNSVPPYLNSNNEILIFTESLWEKMSNYFCILYIERHLIQFFTQR